MDSLSSTWLPPLLGFVCTCIGFALSWVVIRLIGPWVGLGDPVVQRTFVLTVGIANYGYIPLPWPSIILETLLSHCCCITSASIWHYGALGYWSSAANLEVDGRRSCKALPLVGHHRCCDPANWFRTVDSSSGHATSRSLGQCAIPVGLLLGGAIIIDYWRDVRWKESIPTLLLASGVRLLALPILFLLIASTLSRSSHLNEVLLLQASMPAATFPLVLSRLYSGDLPTALRVVVGTSILGLFSIPFWILIGKYWLGLS